MHTIAALSDADLIEIRSFVGKDNGLKGSKHKYDEENISLCSCRETREMNA